MHIFPQSSPVLANSADRYKRDVTCTLSSWCLLPSSFFTICVTCSSDAFRAPIVVPIYSRLADCGSRSYLHQGQLQQRLCKRHIPARHLHRRAFHRKPFSISALKKSIKVYIQKIIVTPSSGAKYVSTCFFERFCQLGKRIFRRLQIPRSRHQQRHETHSRLNLTDATARNPSIGATSFFTSNSPSLTFCHEPG